MGSNRVFSVFLILLILAVSIWSIEANAQSPTLADTLNYIINNVNWTDASPFTSTWSIILANQNMSAFDQAINQYIVEEDYINALYVSRLAELNEHNSTAISEGTRTALQQISMCGSLPINFNAGNYGDPDDLNEGCFLLYNRFLIWAFKYAEEHGLASKWNKNQAFADFASLFDKPPTFSVSGEMLWCDPQENWARSYGSRYYDEHAETLSTFLKFYEIGVQEALAYADEAWAGVQSHWNGQYYGYTGTSVVECEMGNFARIMDEYRQEKGGNISYWERVIQDLNYKLLANNWSSPGWAAPGVIVHATTNPQLRLYETLGAIIALHQLFPQFTPSMKASFYSLLTEDTTAWEGLIQSNLNNEGYFRAVYPGSEPSNEATALAAATLFLEGIAPVTGNLAIPSREENYPADATPFPVKQLRFDYENCKIRIPVNAGELTFIYGSSPVSYNFTANGVYEIEFTSDWNQIIAVSSKPSPPKNLEAIEGNSSISLSWSPPLSDGGAEITNYKIYKGSAANTESFFMQVENVTAYVDMLVTNGETCYYQVTAINSIGESERSNETSTTLSGPVTTDTYDGLWHTSNFSIYLNATDPSGVYETFYKVNNGSIQAVSVNGQPQITVESNSNTLEYWSIDELDKEELPHKMLSQIKLDKTPPNGLIQINNAAGSTTSTSVTLTLTASDATSGIYKVRFSNDGVWNTEEWETYKPTKTWKLTSGDGEKTVYYQIMDNAGLISPTYSDTITLTSPSNSNDSDTAPSPTPSPSPSSTPSPSIPPTPSPTPSPEDSPIFLYAIVVCSFFIAIGLATFLLKRPRKY